MARSSCLRLTYDPGSETLAGLLSGALTFPLRLPPAGHSLASMRRQTLVAVHKRIVITMNRPLDVNRIPREPPEPDTSVLPTLVLIAPPPRANPRLKVTAPSLCVAWIEALVDLPAPVAQKFIVRETRLDPAALAQEFGTFDCVVSPANAFGIMDGG
ncbi:hypothetical protein NUW54_g12538 [Trametes sanguinea]|uniref:Uncharacterized protein n=1 Tax=Trametes sanguinea TaxID=158606 RepID=A0ACC1MXB4_9APHY|nr:hypothetical protein NUW54_g12538 [Trametes sanguinea]